ncbi:hypothetical protein DM794_12955 [Paenarthrobacter ureafaciens]|nr:hypothetical protein [Paenarthrobacter ureafaciens]
MMVAAEDSGAGPANFTTGVFTTGVIQDLERDGLRGLLAQSSGPRTCIGPGRNGLQYCGRPTDAKTSELCRSHSLQQQKQGTLKPLRTRTEKSTCIGPGQDGGLCGRQVYFRQPGQDDGVCKTHYDQLKRRGSMGPIELRLPPLTSTCDGPGGDGQELCGRPSEARDTLLCSAHDRQSKKNDVL